jgi:uncharacterized protein
VIEISDDELVSRFPGRQLDHDNKVHYRGWLNRRLLINRCGDCDMWHERPRPCCPSCWSFNVIPTEVAGTGTIYMAIFLHQGPPAEGVDYSTPYPVVTIELDEQPGLRVSSTVIGSPNDQITIGRRVTLDWIERSGSPMPVFRLVPNEAGE